MIIAILAASSAHCRRFYFPPIDNNVTDFGLQLMRVLPQRITLNSIFSPFGVYAEIVLLHIGSRSHTLRELGRLSGSDNMSESALIEPATQLLYQIWHSRASNVFAMANVILTGPGTSVTYYYQRELTDRAWKATVRNISEYTSVEVNRWAEHITQGRITQLIDRPIRPGTQIMMLNGAYFNGRWKEKFSRSHRAPFFNADYSSSIVSFMEKKGDVEHAFHKGYNVDMISLPYIGSFLKFFMIVPRDQFGIERIKKALNASTLSSLTSMLRKTAVELHVPKFTFEVSYNLRRPLERLGVKSLFTGWAILWRISPVKGIHVTDILHKARITVNNEGGEAITGAKIPTSVTVNADHPFLFFVIAGQRNALLFAGQVNKL